MAAKIQLNLERRIPELRDLERKGVFDAGEIAEIVRRRTQHETAIVRQGTQPKDLLDYVEYENKLETLRKLRVRRLKLPKGPPSVSDYSIPRYILALYARGARRFPNSKQLWRHYIAYTLEGPSPKAISAALTGAIAAHPSSSEFWVMAARWEADGAKGRAGGNIDGARKLIMRGLRFDPNAGALWLEWLRIEVGFAERMRTRWTTLGLLPETAATARPPDEVVQLEEAEDENAMAVETSFAEKAEVAQTEDVAGRQALVEGALAKVVLSNAFDKHIAGEFPASCLALLRRLPESSALRRTLLDLLFSQLSQSTSSTDRMLLLTRPLVDLPATASAADCVEATATVIDALKGLLTAAPTDNNLREAVFAHLVELHRDSEAELASYLAAQLGQLWRSALKRNVATPTLARSRLSQLQTMDVTDVDDESVREARRIADPRAVDEPTGPRSRSTLLKLSARPEATIDDHLALLRDMLESRDATQAPTVLKRLQGRLEPAQAADLEARWVTEMESM